MTIHRECLPNTGLREHLMFLALLIPTFVVIAAAAVSLFTPDEPSVAVPGIDPVAICEPCRSDTADEGP
jgi:hypothetical protein